MSDYKKLMFLRALAAPPQTKLPLSALVQGQQVANDTGVLVAQ